MTEQPNQFRIGQRVRMPPCSEHPDGLSATIISGDDQNGWWVQFRDGSTTPYNSGDLLPETFVELTVDEQSDIEMCLDYVLKTCELFPHVRGSLNSIHNKLKELQMTERTFTPGDRVRVTAPLWGQHEVGTVISGCTLGREYYRVQLDLYPAKNSWIVYRNTEIELLWHGSTENPS